MNRVVDMGRWHSGGVSQTLEEQLRSQIAYYKARLADIQKAPSNSRHREGWDAVATRLAESQYLLARLHSRRERTLRPL